MTGQRSEVAGEPHEPLWSVSDTAQWLGVPVGTLYKWRHLGKGPHAYRLGRHLRYDPGEVRRWLAEGADEAPRQRSDTPGR